jgi:hypothetical protein
MTSIRSTRPARTMPQVRNAQSGFALVLALLALMLLTFLGLTLAATTSSELQIATNYRWSQQALFNAEAGAEAGRYILRTTNWANILPAPRVPGTGWVGGPTQAAITVTPPFAQNDQWGNLTRNFENAPCDMRGAGMGYGVVLDDGTPYQYRTTVLGFNVNGAFTLWVRRPVIVRPDGMLVDYSADNDNLILVSEGTAPNTGGTQTTNLAAANRATQVIEVALSRTPPLAGCDGRQGQTGGGAEGTNFGGCNNTLDATAVGSAIGRAVTENTGVQ